MFYTALYSSSSNGASAGVDRKGSKPVPSDEEMAEVLRRVRLGLLLERGAGSGNARTTGRGLDHLADWGGVLSLGEQQRLAFARCLLSPQRKGIVRKPLCVSRMADIQIVYLALSMPRNLPEAPDSC